MSALFENEDYKLREIAFAKGNSWGYSLINKKNDYHTIKVFFTKIKFLEDRGKGINRYELWLNEEKVGEIFDRELPEKLCKKIEDLEGN